MVFVCEVRGVFQTTSLEHVPNLAGHLGFNGRADEERVRLKFLFGEGFMNSIQRGAGRFPMLVRSCGINAAFEFTQCNVSGRRADGFTGQVAG